MSFNEALNDAPSCLSGEGELLRHGAARLLEGLDQDKLAALEETLGQLYACIKEKRWKKVPDDVLSSIWASCTAILLHGLSGVEVSIRAQCPFCPNENQDVHQHRLLSKHDNTQGILSSLPCTLQFFCLTIKLYQHGACRRVSRHCTFLGP
jgi:hypothetical protein